MINLHSSLTRAFFETSQNRQEARDLARQAGENAQEEEAREAALRREEEAIKAARREQELAEKQQHEGECLQAKVLTQEQEEREERLIQAKMERLREGVLLVRDCV